MQLLQCTAPLPGGSGQCNSCNTLPHCLGAVGSATPAMHCRTTWGQWAVQLLPYAASLPGGSGQWNSCNALSHCLGAVGSATPAMHCRTAWGQWAVELLQHTASLPGGSGQWNSCNALPHCLGAVGSGTPAIPIGLPASCWSRMCCCTGPLMYCRPLRWVAQVHCQTAGPSAREYGAIDELPAPVLQLRQ